MNGNANFLIALPGPVAVGPTASPLDEPFCLTDVSPGLTDTSDPSCPNTDVPALQAPDEPFQQGPTSPFVSGGPSDLPTGATPTLTGEPITPTTIAPESPGLTPLTPGLEGGVVGSIPGQDMAEAIAAFVQTPSGAGIVLVAGLLIFSFLRT